jgi:nicotinamide riboside kinase
MMQVAASNAEQIERKKQLAQQEWEEEMRIAEYIRQKDAREQVRLRAGISSEAVACCDCHVVALFPYCMCVFHTNCLWQ